MRIEIDNLEIICDVQYGKRKKLSIHIDSAGFITVKSPQNLSEEDVRNTIKINSNWIKGKLDEISKLKVLTKKKEYKDYGKFFYLGKEYFLNELIDTNNLDEEELKIKLKKYYTSNLKKVIGERIKVYEQQLGVKPKSIDIIESKTKWGSCNINKKITFNYRLVMVPIEVIDYVVVHELCHLIHMNHDRSFWRRVGSIIPDYKISEAFLLRNGQFMSL